MLDLSNPRHRQRLTDAASDLLRGRPKVNPRTSAKVRKGEVKTTMPTDKWTRTTRKQLIRKDNAAEDHIHGLLNQCGVTFHRERPVEIAGKKYFIDFMVISVKEGRRKIRVAIEVDGGYHFTPEQQEADKRKDADLLKCQRVWSVLRIEASVAMRMNAADLFAALTSMPSWEVRRMY